MPKLIKPNLAATLDKLSDCNFPVIVSPKYDGIRATVQNGVVYSRTLKPIPNRHVQEAYRRYEGCDGELILGDPVDPMCFRNTTSIVMSDDKSAAGIEFHVFDVLDMNTPYHVRRNDRRVTVPSKIVTSLAELKSEEERLVKKGWEGIIIRNPDSLYKQGRSTVREGGLLKYKRFFDSEATIIGWHPRYENCNPQEINELGRSKRSTKQAGLVAMDTIGALDVTWKGQEFSIGSGLDEAEAAKLWKLRGKLPGMKVKFKYQLASGKPRFPIYLGLRDDRDM